MSVDVIDNLDHKLNKLIDFGVLVSSIAILLIIAFVVIASIGRYITGTMVIPGLYEMTGFYLMPLAVFPALVFSYMNGTFPAVENLFDKFPEKYQRWVKILFLLIEIVLFVVLTYETFQYALTGTAKDMGMRAGANIWPLYPFLYLAPYGFALLTLKAVIVFLKLTLSKVDIIKSTQVE
ncbi:MAG: TRAP transporter small permease [Syntrophomonadaceae bacterium]|jgi:TRAP-type C4-dicarboxylate transport system permease small subunit